MGTFVGRDYKLGNKNWGMSSQNSGMVQFVNGRDIGHGHFLRVF